MTRLIDADALIENHFSPSHRIALSYADKQWMRKIINEAPTVEAIPIEWIETEIQRFKEGKTPENHADIFAAVLQGMIDAWRKEE